MRNHPNRSRVAANAISAALIKSHDHDLDYSALLAAVSKSFAGVEGPLFITDVVGLNDIYLDNLPGERQVHNCHACRHFIERFGGFVTISDDGSLLSAMWRSSPGFYAASFAAMRESVESSKVVGAFLSDQKVWGTPITGKWSHMAIAPAANLIFRERGKTPFQAMAAIKENYRTVVAALAEFKPAGLDEAIRILEADAVARSDRFIAPVRWLRGLHDRPKGRAGQNLLWRAVAMAPEGFCHPKASMIGSLLEDIAAGMAFDDIKARFDAKMHPLRYQRPQVAPSAGNIKGAEALVERLGIAPSLERRFARLDEMRPMWTPQVVAEKPTEGVFGHLIAKGEIRGHIALPDKTMTWEKFAHTVLPNALKLELLMPGAPGRFVAMTTAVNADAPPILKWDREEARNPVAWYTYPAGSPAHQWGLKANTWVPVTAIVQSPSMWGDRPMDFLSNGLALLLAGAVDSNDGGNALFPECLRDDLHSVRATIEAYSRAAKLSGREQASACGLGVSKAAANCVIRAFSSGAWYTYRIDRWD